MAENFDPQEFGNKLRQAREAKGMSLDALVEALEQAGAPKSKTWLSETERGVISPTNPLFVVFKIATILEVDLWSLLSLDVGNFELSVAYFSGFFDALLLRGDETRYSTRFTERYFKSTNALNSQEQITSLDKRWNRIEPIIKALAKDKHKSKDYVDFATILTHYLYSSLKIEERIELCTNAATLCRELFQDSGNSDWRIAAYLLEMDGVCWMLLQQGKYNAASELLKDDLGEITELLENDYTGTSPFQDIRDLGEIIYVYVFLRQGQLDEANKRLQRTNVNPDLIDIAIIKCRYWIARGDVARALGNRDKNAELIKFAIDCYVTAKDILEQNGSVGYSALGVQIGDAHIDLARLVNDSQQKEAELSVATTIFEEEDKNQGLRLMDRLKVQFGFARIAEIYEDAETARSIASTIIQILDEKNVSTLNFKEQVRKFRDQL